MAAHAHYCAPGSVTKGQGQVLSRCLNHYLASASVPKGTQGQGQGQVVLHAALLPPCLNNYFATALDKKRSLNP